ncbi:hypothetical protein T02_14734 [Trichinella nativa]|uniref:Uncharacterized protein n=1 Tax=Trichinella nativa TaxID=6335 RepID=A0A0V1KWS6_9BILA|nr:hypothetical protein T02_14734 [Trichinella nativa]
MVYFRDRISFLRAQQNNKERELKYYPGNAMTSVRLLAGGLGPVVDPAFASLVGIVLSERSECVAICAH